MEVVARSLATTGCEFYEFRPQRTVEYLQRVGVTVPNLETRLQSYGLIVFSLSQEEYQELIRWTTQWNQSCPQMPASLRVENFEAESCLVVGEYADDQPLIAPAPSPPASEMSLGDDVKNDDDDDDSEDSDVDTAWAQDLVPPDQLSESMDLIAVIQIG